MTDSDIQEAIVKVLKRFAVVKRVFLFGSRARGDHQPKSDFDIAIDCPEATGGDWVDLAQAIESIPTLLTIQLVRYNTSSIDLQDRIQQEGIVLYERKS